jgi:uncharacterized membrane protein YsdA (DUF1294 family)
MTPQVRNIAWNTLAFMLITVAVCIVNYILQIIIIFMDIFSRRLEESVAYIIVLWLVTGIFGSVFTTGLAEHLVKKENFTYKVSGNTILVISILAIIPAIVIMSKGHFMHNPKEFTLLLSNGYVWVAYFAGAGGMAAILRNLDK